MRLNQIALLLLFLVLENESLSQFNATSNARSAAIGNASVTISDAWSHFNNPAAVTHVETVEVGVYYSSRFSLKELQTQCFVLALPISKGVISIGGQVYGFKGFRYLKQGISYGLQLTPSIAIGTQLNYHGIRFSGNYRPVHMMTAEIGIFTKISDQLNLGFTASNIGNSKFRAYDLERLMTVVKIGIGYKVANNTTIVSEIEKGILTSFRSKFGVEYEMNNQFYLRGGLQTNPVEFSFGFGYKKKLIKFDLGSSYHRYLGWSPFVSLNRSF